MVSTLKLEKVDNKIVTFISSKIPDDSVNAKKFHDHHGYQIKIDYSSG